MLYNKYVSFDLLARSALPIPCLGFHLSRPFSTDKLSHNSKISKESFRVCWRRFRGVTVYLKVGGSERGSGRQKPSSGVPRPPGWGLGTKSPRS